MEIKQPLLLISVLLCAAFAAAAQTARPTTRKVTVPPEKAVPLHVSRFDKAPVIDGKLDDEVWKEYKKKGRHNEFNPVKKQALNLFGFSTVRTTTLGSVKKGVFNEYYYKWINKLILLGEKQY